MLNDIQREMRVLFNEDGTYGVEGKRRMAEALRESAALLRKRAEQVAEGAEVRRRAEEITREERINKQAEALARMNRNTL